MECEDWQDSGGQLKHMFSPYSITFVHVKLFFSSFIQHISLLLLFLIPPCLLCYFHFLPFNFFFPLDCAAPPRLPSPPVSLAPGLLNYAFYLHAALQYSVKVEAYFHHMCTSETIQLPQLSPFICHPPFLPPMTFRKKNLIIFPLPLFPEDSFSIIYSKTAPSYLILSSTSCQSLVFGPSLTHKHIHHSSLFLSEFFLPTL